MNNSHDLICFSHLRWGFVFQRPQHLISRFARSGRAYFFEEPVYEGDIAKLNKSICSHTGVTVVTPVLPRSHFNSASCTSAAQASMLQELIREENISEFIAWYYTPMAIEFTAGLRPRLTVYDCMDELSAFLGAPPAMHRNEDLLFKNANLVFTGGASLYESKKSRHPAVYLFPSSVDASHFARARQSRRQPEDQRKIACPRLGYAGVIDERMDLDLVSQVARKRPDWQIVILGPIVKIDPATLPQSPNIHYLGMKPYEDLPRYFSGWSAGIIPFAQNESTRFISPTKTLEYLAAGLRVVSTPIWDVVKPYGENGLVEIAGSSDEFVSAVERLFDGGDDALWRAQATSFLSSLSWDKTWLKMQSLIADRMVQPCSAAAAGSRIAPVKEPAMQLEQSAAVI